MAMAWKRDATYLLAFCYQRNGLAEAKYYGTKRKLPMTPNRSVDRMRPMFV